MLPKLSIVDFSYLDKTQLLEILSLRNSDYVRNRMATSDEILEDTHLLFCKNLKQRTDALFCGVYLEDKLVGVIDLKGIDLKSKSYESGCYFCKNSKNITYFANLAAFIIAKDIGLTKATCYVKKDNIQAVLFNTMKLRYRTTKETDEFYYFEKDLDTPKNSIENLKAKISSSFELFINFNKSKYVND